MQGKYWFRVLLMGLMVMTLVMAGCSGDDGNDGAQGIQGEQGEQGVAGEPGPVTHSNESCVLCHGEDARLDLKIDAIHPGPGEIPVVEVVSIASVAGGYNSATGVGDSVTFNVFEADGKTPILGLKSTDFRFYIADMLPAGVATTTTYNATNLPNPLTVFVTDQPARWAYERDRDGYLFGELTENDYNAATLPLPFGQYTYTFASDLAAGGSALVVPVAPVMPVVGDYKSQQDYEANFQDDMDDYEDDLADYNLMTIAAPDFDIDHTQRLLIRAPGSAGLLDFFIPLDGASTTGLAALSRDIVARSACTSCHGDPLEQAAHGGGYQSMAACVVCHTPIGNTYGEEMQETGAFAVNFYHKIHAAIPMPAWEDRIGGEGYGAVKYPDNIQNCEKCHFDDGQSEADAWTIPSNVACGSCHGVIHSGTQADNQCIVCHAADGSGSAPSVTGAHVAEQPHAYFSTITLEADANGDGIYEAGETPLITVTVADADGAAISIYNSATTEFTNANLYVYGPRNAPVPVLTPGTSTDPAFDPETETADQGRSMFVNADDAQVETDADGFKYRLMEIPEDLEAGTYMIMAYVTHPTSLEWYRTTVGQDGWQLITFQVGTATETKAIAGDCTVCHQPDVWGSMYHRGYFAEDGCIACHDLSGNHANWLGNRVHAVHSEQPQGDLLGPVDEWADITFPRNTNSCEACHNSGNEQYREDPNMYAPNCYGCHGATLGLQDHMIQNGATVFGSH